jgi:hypothetical protein
VLVDEVTSCRTVVSFGTVVQPPRKTVPRVSNKAKIRIGFIGCKDGASVGIASPKRKPFPSSTVSRQSALGSGTAFASQPLGVLAIKDGTVVA